MLAGILWLLVLAMVILMVVGGIRPDLAKNKKTGEVPSSGQVIMGFAVLAAILSVAALAVELASPSEEKPAASAATTPAPKSSPPATKLAPTTQPNHIKPEQIVEFPKGEAACLTREALQKFTVYSLSGQATKARGLFVGSDGELGECIMLPPSSRARVIEAQYNDPQIPDAGILEIVGTDVTASEQGAFVLVVDQSMVKVIG